MIKKTLFLFTLLFSLQNVLAQPTGNQILRWIGQPVSEPSLATVVQDIEKNQHSSLFDQTLNRYEIKSFSKGMDLIFNQNFVLSELHFYDSGHLYTKYDGDLPTGLTMRMHIDYFKERFQNFEVDTFNQFIYHGRFANGTIDVYFKNRHIELIKITGDSRYIENQDRENMKSWGMRIIPDGRCEQGNCIKGEGTMKWVSGLSYNGEWDFGIPHGTGIIADTQQFQYSGGMKLGFLWGDGTISVPGQYRYKGSFLLGKRYGKGECRFANGTRYEGEWVNDLMHGYGQFYFSETYRYEGYLRDNQFNGKGTLHTPEGYINGYFKDGKPHGFGTQVALNKATLKGKWVNGKKEGEFEAYTPELGDYKVIFENDIEIRKYRDDD